MGKYDKLGFISSVTEKSYLCAIANELAEMNRLKRLELNEKYGKSDWAKDMQSDQT